MTTQEFLELCALFCFALITALLFALTLNT